MCGFCAVLPFFCCVPEAAAPDDATNANVDEEAGLEDAVCGGDGGLGLGLALGHCGVGGGGGGGAPEVPYVQFPAYGLPPYGFNAQFRSVLSVLICQKKQFGSPTHAAQHAALSPALTVVQLWACPRTHVLAVPEPQLPFGPNADTPVAAMANNPEKA